MGPLEDDISEKDLEAFNDEPENSEDEYSYDDLGQEDFSEDSELESATAVGEDEEDEDEAEMDGFADADDFAELLEDSGSTGLNKKQEKWEQRTASKKRKFSGGKSFSKKKPKIKK